MSRTKSTMMLQLGAQAPEFSLPDAKGRLVSRSDCVGKPLLVAFLCNHCDCVQKMLPDFVTLAQDFVPQGLGIVAINPNATGASATESPEEMVRLAQASGFNFAYLVDESQRVAKSYRAACTPDFFLFDNNHKLVYRGQLTRVIHDGEAKADEQDNGPIVLRQAVVAVLNKQPPLPHQSPSWGCPIEWQEGHAPPYAAHYVHPNVEG